MQSEFNQSFEDDFQRNCSINIS